MQAVLWLRGILQGFSWVIWLVAIALSIGIGFLFSDRSEKRKVAMEQAMAASRFSLRYATGDTWEVILVVLVWSLALPFFRFVADGVDELTFF